MDSLYVFKTAMLCEFEIKQKLSKTYNSSKNKHRDDIVDTGYTSSIITANICLTFAPTSRYFGGPT